MDVRPWYAGAAVVAGVVWGVAPVVFVVGPAGFPNLYRLLATSGFLEGYRYLVLLAPPLFVVGLAGYYRAYAGAYALSGRVGIALLAIGVLCVVPLAANGTVVTYALPTGVLVMSLAGVGAVVAELGTVGIALDAWRTGVPSEHLALWLPLALPVGVATNYLAGAVILSRVTYLTGAFGLAWIALGYRLQNPASRPGRRQ